MSESNSLYVNDEVLCETVELADSFFKKATGRMFTPSMPKDLGLIFSFDDDSPVGVHMFFVFYHLGVIWVEDGEVVDTRKLPPWIGYHKTEADAVIEVHPDKIDQVSVGDEITQK